MEQGQAQNGYDRLYVPQIGYTTGDIDIHDIAVDRDGRVIFINTLFSCLATVSDKYSFVYKAKERIKEMVVKHPNSFVEKK